MQRKRDEEEDASDLKLGEGLKSIGFVFVTFKRFCRRTVFIEL